MRRSIAFAAVAVGVALASSAGLLADEQKEKKGGPVKMTGEVVDLMCYLDHGAKGADHADCAEKCIRMGGPVGLLVDRSEIPGDAAGKKKGDSEHVAVLVIGKHKPANDMLVEHAAQTITLKGSFVSRSDMHMLQKVRLVEGG